MVLDTVKHRLNMMIQRLLYGGLSSKMELLMQFKFSATVAVAGLSLAFFAYGETTNTRPLLGFDPANVTQERELEARFDASLKKDNLRDWMKRMTAKPHHVGSPFGKEVADFIASQFRSWGY